MTGPEVTYFEGQKWQVMKPQIARDGAGGYAQTGAPAKVDGASRPMRLGPPYNASFASKPPSTTTAAPVIYDASFEARK